MSGAKYKPEELKQLLEVANSIIGQLEYFKIQFSAENRNIDGPAPIGMNDVEAERYVLQLEAVNIVFEEMLWLKEEPMIAWVKLLENGKETIYLVSRSYTPNGYKPKDHPNVKYISKLTPLAARLFSMDLQNRFTFGNAEREILFRDRYFKPYLEPLPDATDNTIELKTNTFTIESLRKILELNKYDITAEYNVKLQELLKELDFREGIRRRIISNIALRDQPILDKEQIKLYRYPLSGSIIVSGCAGTGKTTVVLQRISLATKPDNLSNDEKVGITKQGLDQLNKQKDNWVLYTPTELLKSYLKEAFNKENIPATEEKIKTWHSERWELGRNVLKYLRIGDTGYFRITQKDIFKIKSNIDLEQFSDKFEQFYLEAVLEKFNKSFLALNEYDTSTEFPKRFAEIKDQFSSYTETNVWRKIYYLMDMLSQQKEYCDQVRGANARNQEDLIKHIIENNPGIIDSISNLIKEEIIEEEKLEEDVTEQDDEEVEPVVDRGVEEIRFKALQQLNKTVGRYSESLVKKQNIKSSSISGKIVELVKDDLAKIRDSLLKVGERRVALKNANLLTKGFVRNMIVQIPVLYSQFRNILMKKDNQRYYNETFMDEIKEKKYIAEIEADIIAYHMLNNARYYFSRNGKALRENTNIDVLENIKSEYKNIVCVDEATDFPGITLGCMNCLCHPDIKSFTLAGDPMQRITENGITNWEDVKHFVPKYEVKQLKKVYRQSHKLLELAKQLYKTYVGEPTFESALGPDKYEPDALMYHNKDNESLINWLVKRILEVYKITGGKVSIALFVAEESMIDNLADILEESLEDNSLEVERCRMGKIISNNSKVRIFSIEYIKGLEFEAVFLIDIDKISISHPNLIDKYLYVGLTRAGSFMAISYSGEFPKELDCVKDRFKSGDWSHLSK